MGGLDGRLVHTGSWQAGTGQFNSRGKRGGGLQAAVGAEMELRWICGNTERVRDTKAKLQSATDN